MTPQLNGRTHTFAEHGLYDGLFLMRDDETETFWDHLTGEAVYGPLVGQALPISTLIQTTVAQVLNNTPGALVGLSDQAIRRDDQLTADGLLAGIRGQLNRMFSSTIDELDTRRPTMDLGMGVWDGEVARYYPYDVVQGNGNAIVDTFQGRRVLVYLDPTAFVLSALYVEGDNPQWTGTRLNLSNGTYVEGGLLYDTAGDRLATDPPLQVFTRWYGFSLTFPGTDIYER